MIRAATSVILSLIAVAVGYLLLFADQPSHGAGFSAGNLHVEYMACAPGLIRHDRIKYVVLSDGFCPEGSTQEDDAKHTRFHRLYRRADQDTTIVFETKPGQTVWIGKDRKPHFARRPLQLSEVYLLKKYAGSEMLRAIGSVEDLQAALDKLKEANKQDRADGQRGLLVSIPRR
jgi:hypothetical protein